MTYEQEQKLKEYARSEARNWQLLAYFPYDISIDNLASFWFTAMNYGMELQRSEQGPEQSAATMPNSSTGDVAPKDLDTLAEEVLAKYHSMNEYPDYYHESQVISAMEEMYLKGVEIAKNNQQ
jgi:hypothetical protein